MNLAATELRMVFHAKNVMLAACTKLAVANIEKGPNSFLKVVDYSLDDDPDYPTVVIIVEEIWQGDYETHTLVIPLEDFVDLYQHVTQK